MGDLKILEFEILALGWISKIRDFQDLKFLRFAIHEIWDSAIQNFERFLDFRFLGFDILQVKILASQDFCDCKFLKLEIFKMYHFWDLRCSRREIFAIKIRDFAIWNFWFVILQCWRFSDFWSLVLRFPNLLFEIFEMRDFCNLNFLRWDFHFLNWRLWIRECWN